MLLLMLFLTKTVRFLSEFHLLPHGKKRKPSVSTASVYCSAIRGLERQPCLLSVSVGPNAGHNHFHGSLALHCQLSENTNASRSGHQAPNIPLQTQCKLTVHLNGDGETPLGSLQLQMTRNFLSPSRSGQKSRQAWGKEAMKTVPTVAPK